MDSVIGAVVGRADRPAHVSFHREAVEDRAASIAQGKFVSRDVDFIHITPPYSKDIFKQKVSAWLLQLQQDVANNRIPQQWADQYIAGHKAWMNGQELPLNGSAIKGWGVISPAQQENLIQMKILTVEDLAAVNDEGIRQIGMGGTELKHKANAWLAQLQDKGPLTIKMAALETSNANLKADLDRALDAIEKLQRDVSRADPPLPMIAPLSLASIEASDILPSEDDMAAAYKAKFGRNPHPNMKPENLAAAVQE